MLVILFRKQNKKLKLKSFFKVICLLGLPVGLEFPLYKYFQVGRTRNDFNNRVLNRSTHMGDTVHNARTRFSQRFWNK